MIEANNNKNPRLENLIRASVVAMRLRGMELPDPGTQDLLTKLYMIVDGIERGELTGVVHSVREEAAVETVTLKHFMYENLVIKTRREVADAEIEMRKR